MPDCWGNTYIFEDGSTPVEEIREQFEKLSWAVPITTFLRKAPRFRYGTKIPTDFELENSVPPPSTIKREERVEPSW